VGVSHFIKELDDQSMEAIILAEADEVVKTTLKNSTSSALI
jgi:hypothetical protein